ncbi:dihydrodipicolinate synthase family protein [Mesoaciditoga lauensis]|uniref:dihydrodipicolinate synthase family protein n=1 Tax=Mesoaciditoga lauensis TaxID=1495039 RepID=UPI00055B2616|nr:dihydrodipicolinate synthase family protein [Mesoaciditoga lauensis]
MSKEVIVPIITPLNSENKVNKSDISTLVRYLSNSRITGIFVGGSTGEFVALSTKNQIKVLEAFVENIPERLKLYLGISSTSFQKVLELVTSIPFSLKQRIDAYVCSAPFYFRYSYNDLREFFLTIANSVDKPLILYNIPQFTNETYIPLSLLKELSNHQNIIGIKESSKNFLYYQDIVFSKNNKFLVYQGAEEYMYASMTIGSNGLVPGIGNVVPEACCFLANSYENPQSIEIQKRIIELMDIYKDLSWVSSIKIALHVLGIIDSYFSVISSKPSIESIKRIEKILESHNDLFKLRI